MREYRYLGMSLCLAMGACGGGESDSGNDDTDTKTVVKLATWYGAPGELEALQEVLNDYTETRPEALVELVSVPVAAPGRLEAYHGGVEWDLGMQTQPFLGATEDVVYDLSTVEDVQSKVSAINPRFRNMVEPDALIGVPMSVIRLNALVYDVEALPSPPQTITEWQQLCDDYVAGGRTGPAPMTTVSPGVDPRAYLLFALGFLPADVVSGSASDPEPAVRAAFELIQQYRDQECIYYSTDENGGGASWDDMVQVLIDGNAMALINGDWAAGYLVASGLVAGRDFATADPLGGDAAYVSTVEVMLMNASTKRVQEGGELLATLLQPETQLSFAARRGSVPAVTIEDPESQIRDSGVRALYDAFAKAEQSSRLVSMAPWIASGSKPLELLDPFIAGDIDADEVITGYLADY